MRRLILAVRNASRPAAGLEEKAMEMSVSDLHTSLYSYYHLLAPLLKEKDIS